MDNVYDQGDNSEDNFAPLREVLRLPGTLPPIVIWQEAKTFAQFRFSDPSSWKSDPQG
jgi:hypothetical protein